MSSSLSHHPSPALFFETVNAFQRTAALKAGVELDLFSALGAGPLPAGELASRCGCALRGIRILADHLTLLGFLTKQADLYSLTQDSAMFLDRKSPAFAGGAVEFLTSHAIHDCFSHLTAAVRRGGTASSELGTIAPEHPVWLHFAQGMGPLMQPVAAALARLLPLDSNRDTRVLDVSASHGVYGIAFALQNPRARVVGLDWAAVLDISVANAQKAGVGDRYERLPGSAFEADLGTGYDLILIPNFLHHFNPSDCVQFLRKAHAALRPGGRVAVVEFVPDEDRVTPPPAAGFSLVMLATTPEGDAYTFSEYQQMLTQSGFSQITAHPLKPSASTAVIASR